MILLSDKDYDQVDLFPLALLIFGMIYWAQTIFIGWFLIDWHRITGVVYFIGFELLFLGIAYDMTESLFAIFAKPKRTPVLSQLQDYPFVALLMTVCDDVILNRWQTLLQTYPHCDIFILDDSKHPDQRLLVDQSGYTVIRRGKQGGFKAGNLNNWFDQYGPKYKYFAILDSDSLVRHDFIEKMVAYAEHPANQNIAIFQSFILPTDANTLFSKALGNMAKMRFFILERFANRAGLILSWGHNQLLRTEAVRKVGGFCELISPEDTTLSLTLSAIGYSVRLVNVDSYDTDPLNVIHFTRRIVRWAGQTAELFSLPWGEASFRLKLLICYHFYNYTVHNFYLALLLLTAWGFDSRNISPLRLFEYIAVNNGQLWPWTIVLAELTLLWLVQLLMRLYICSLAGISFKKFFENMILSTSLYCFMGLAADISVIRGFTGHKIEFAPTNAAFKNSLPNTLEFIGSFLFWFCSGSLILMGMVMRNRLLFFSLNGLWVVFWSLAPVILLLFHQDQFFWRKK